MVSYFTHGVTLAYRTFGTGPTPVLAFHGFGRTGEDFAVLEAALGEGCTIHAFDLHFHGQSPSYPERAERPFTPEELAIFFAAFADHIGAARTCLLGYSLGGRIVLNLLERMPQRIDRAFLAAPDGLKTRPWYRGLAGSRLGRRAYRGFVLRPRAVHLLIHGARKLRLIHERMHRFLIGQTDSRAKRELLRDVWLSFRLIEPSLPQVAANAVRYGIPIHLFFGVRDTVIPPALGARLRSLAPDHITQEELPFGHVLLTPELGTAIAAKIPKAGSPPNEKGA